MTTRQSITAAAVTAALLGASLAPAPSTLVADVAQAAQPDATPTGILWPDAPFPDPPADDEAALPIAARPNIVVFYLDDVPAIDGRLWSDQRLTPNIYEHFVAGGVHFPNAVGETPLCCPGRAGLLTGLHTHNHGVVANFATYFNPAEHIGKELSDAGYATMWVGKYFNKNSKLTAQQWNAHGAGWTWLDVIYGWNGAFLNYKLRTKTATIAFPTTHSTQMAAERTADHIRATPAEVPVFAVVSMYNLHAPNTPMPGFEGDARWDECAAMPPWNPPNYNEADVSDKPAAVAAHPLLPYPDGWPLVGYCREMLGVDWAVGRVVDELEAEGRLDNTLLIFTSDNGMGWGAHRIGQNKVFPYTTPVPLYMAWPARWGSQPREIPDAVTNIDLAPTFCAVGGCALEDYPFGQSGPDGLSLLPLLDGDLQRLARDELLESDWVARRKWAAVRTSPDHALGAWHYVEWSTGERELYDLAADPWELDNRAADPSLAEVRTRLAERLAALLREGVQHRPDASVRRQSSSAFVGRFTYEAAPSADQTVQAGSLAAGASATFIVRVTNDGGAADTFGLRGTASGTAPGTVSYKVNGVYVTRRVKAGTYRLSLAAHTSVDVTVVIKLGLDAPAGSARSVVLKVTSVAESTRVDAVRMVAAR